MVDSRVGRRRGSGSLGIRSPWQRRELLLSVEPRKPGSVFTRLRGQALLASLPLLVMLLALFGVWRLEHEVQLASNLTERSDERLFTASQLQLRLVDAETGIRGYAVTRNRDFLTIYDAAVAQIPVLMAQLRATRHSEAARKELTGAAKAVDAQMLFLARARRAIELGQSSQVDVELVRGKQSMDAIRGLIGLYQSTERTLNAGRRAHFAAITNTLGYALGGTFLFTVFAGIYMIFFIANRILTRLAAVVVKTEQVSAGQDLGAPVKGNDEIAAVDRAVIQMAAIIRARSAEHVRYGLLAGSTRDAIFFIDQATMRIVEANQSAVNSYGYTADEFKSLSVPDLRIPSERAAVSILSEMSEGSSLTLESIAQRKDGSSFPIEIAARSATVDGHRMILGVTRDTTESKRAEAALVHAKELAEEAARMKSDFLANMSHEIRTPMNAIIGLAYLTRKTTLDRRQADYIEKIQQSSQHLLRIINDILDFSKIEAGKVSIEVAEFDLEQLLHDVSNVVSASASSKGIELIFDVDPKIAPGLSGDSLRLGQILINFCNNAVKFTEAGEVSVRVRVDEDSPTEQLVHFAVSDTGIGLTGQQAERLFQPFQQADASVTRKFGGSGLGLVISKSLAELMGGTIGVTSELGRGSTFWFTARLVKNAGGVQRQLPRQTEDLRDRRVLLVDDNAYSRSVESSLLTSLTFVVDQAPSGEVGVEMVRSAAVGGKPYEIVFLDWKMPGMDGIETARQIRALPALPAPKFIMITAHSGEDIFKGAIDDDFFGILIKPVQPSQLFDVVMRALGGTQARREERAAFGAAPAPGFEQLHGARVLLVEDSEVNVMVATGIMEDAKLSIDVAGDGEIAIRMLQSVSYDLVLMDMQMPVMGGIDATIAIRADGRFAQLPIIAMTANAMASDREQCLAAGMNAHIAKPIDPNELLRLLKEWIKPRSPLPPRDSSEGAFSTGEMPEIAGINTRDGIERVGNRKRYEWVLRQFVADEAMATDKILVAYTAGDTATAERGAHSLRGDAGSIGATDLEACAGAVELAVRSGTGVVAALDTLSHELSAVVAAINSTLPLEA